MSILKAYKKKGFVLITTIYYVLIIFLIINLCLHIISSNRRNLSVERKIDNNVNSFYNINEVINNLNNSQSEIKYVVENNIGKNIGDNMVLRFNESEDRFFITKNEGNAEKMRRMRLDYIICEDDYIIFPTVLN